MIREEPFSTLHIILQEGKYDHPDRLFNSIGAAWASVTGNSNDFRELIPEFFFSHHFLCNHNEFDLGVLLDGTTVNDVVLPPWAHSSFEFISLHRKALESDYVSQHINEWIDLIFGVNRRSKEHNNVFHLFSYSDLVMQLLQNNDDATLALAKHHCANFGCCPEILFTSPHPKRAILSTSNSSGSLLSTILPYPSEITRKTKLLISPNLTQAKFADSILFLGEGFILTTNEIVNIQSGRTYQISTTLYPPHRYVLCELISKLSIIVTILHGSSFATVTKLMGDGSSRLICSELATLAHKGSVILCATNIDNEYIATGGSDCAINIFSTKDWKLVCTLPFHTLPISCIGGNSSLGILVSIDEGNQVFCSNITTRRFIHAFALDCSETCEHKVLVLDSGLIAVSSCEIKSGTNKLDLYDLRGSLLKKIDLSIGFVRSINLKINTRVVKLLSIPTNYDVPYICLTTKSKHTIVIDGCSLKPIKTFVESIIPELAAPTTETSDSRSLYVINSSRTIGVLNF
jgi:WD40 repeat protein